MAEGPITFLAEVAIILLLEKVKEIKIWHSKLISGSENDFKELCKGLLFLKAFFEDASNHPLMTEMFRSEMDKRIRDLVFDIEDAIEAWLLKAELSTMIIIVVIRHHLYPLSLTLSIAKLVRRLRIRKLTPVYDELKRKFHQQVASFAVVDVSNAERPAFRVGIKSKSILQEKFVGFKDEEDAILGRLMEETNELSVISICGVDGSGKTTLAKKIFEDEKIWLEFPVRIWISACKRFKSRDVFLNILKRFIGDDMSNSSDHELARAVHLCLSEKKFVLVVDDLRSIGDWKAVEEALPRSNALGKVLITTKDLNTAEYVCSVGPLMIRSLSEEESMELLKDSSPDPGLIDGRKLARASGGLPLACVVIGGILMDMHRKNRWPTHFEETLNAKMKISGSDSLESQLQQLVELSYSRLPGYLKECFLFLAMFPVDHAIPTRKLTQLWIGEGFIPPKEGKALEATAEECLDELIRRKLVMVDSVNPVGEIKSCRVHNVVRKFARSKAIEHDLFQEILNPEERVLKVTTRLCLHSGLPEFLSEKQILSKRVRSLYCFNSQPAHLSLKHVATISDAFKPLRVLDSKFTEFPSWITKLIHLRYVTLSIADLTVVPETISQLFNLQTLVVETKSPSITMKANIWRMYRLRHFQTKAAIVLDKKFEGKAGESLQTVGRLSPESCTDDFPERAPNLRRLAIRGYLWKIIMISSLFQKLHLLHDLKLVNDDPSASDMPAPLNGLRFPRALKKLTLMNTFLKWEHMSTLADIKTLEVLKLKENAFTGIHWSAVDYRFPKLHFLLIANTDLVHWEASANSFPQLSCLVIKMCENLNEIPEAIFNKLSKLYLERVGKYAVQSAWKIAKAKASRGFKLSVC